MELPSKYYEQNGIFKEVGEINYGVFSYVSASIMINRKPRGMVYPKQGLRHGDPLSPYLFLLCAEGLFGMLLSVVECC